MSLKEGILHFLKTVRIVGVKTNTPKEAKEKVVELKRLNEDAPKNLNPNLQAILDWAGQPTTIGVVNKEQAMAQHIMSRGYWEAIGKRNAQQRPIIHQHLHVHQGDTEEEFVNEAHRQSSDAVKLLEALDLEMDLELDLSNGEDDEDGLR